MNNKRYKIIRELGRNYEGGRITYLAVDTLAKPPKQVAMKQFSFAQSGADWSSFKASEREIKVLRELNHSCIPRYLDSFETENGFCLVQEYKNATSLTERYSFEPEEIKQIGRSLLSILVYLQNRIPPVIHRDIKPENILMDKRKKVYLVDFGLARRKGAVAASSMMGGTMGFMSPEQLFNRPLTEASDLYSVGATLIVLLTGTRSVDIGKLVDEENRFDFKHLDPSLNPDFVQWLKKMVAPNAKHRYQNAAAALKALERLDITGKKKIIPLLPLAGVAGFTVAALLGITAFTISRVIVPPTKPAAQERPNEANSRSKPSEELNNKDKPKSPQQSQTKPSNPSVSESELFERVEDKAIGAYNISKTAHSKQDWDLVASGWREAIALLQTVPSNSPKYPQAQAKIKEYQTYLARAQGQAVTPWQKALNLGAEAVDLSKSAKSKENWEVILNKWYQAIAQLEEIPGSSPHRDSAPAKIREYLRNLYYAEQQFINRVTPANFMAAIPCKPDFQNLRSFLYYCGKLGDYRGTEGEGWFTPQDGDFRAYTNHYGAVTISYRDGYERLNVVLAPPRKTKLKKGTYDGARYYNNQRSSKPRLRFSYKGRSCYKPTGKFTVHEIIYGDYNRIEFLDASIEQYCEQKDAKLFAHVRYHISDSPK